MAQHLDHIVAGAVHGIDQGSALVQAAGDQRGEHVAHALDRMRYQGVLEHLAHAFAHDCHLDAPGRAQLRRGAGHHHPAGGVAEQRAGGVHAVVQRARAAPGQLAEFKMVGAQALGQRQQVVAPHWQQGRIGIDAVVVIADHRVDLYPQRRIDRLHPPQPRRQRDALLRRAEVADHHASGAGCRLAGLQVIQQPGEPVQR